MKTIYIIVVVAIIVMSQRSTSAPAINTDYTSKYVEQWWKGIPKETFVAKLDTSNIGPIVEAYPVFIMFYTTLCGSAAAAREDFAYAASSLYNLDTVVGSVDCDDSRPVCNKYGVHSYPKFLYVWNGSQTEFTGDDLTKDNFMDWVMVEDKIAARRRHRGVTRGDHY